MTDRSVEVLYNAATIGVLHVRGSLTTFQFNDDYHECSPRPIVGQQFEASGDRLGIGGRNSTDPQRSAVWKLYRIANGFHGCKPVIDRWGAGSNCLRSILTM